MVTKSKVLVIIQFACLIYFVLSGRIPQAWYLILAVILGLGLGLWALLIMRESKFSVFPEPKQGSQLIEKGPYQFIRHPMYTSILLVCGALALDRGGALFLLFLVLLINQLVKLKHEEGLLIEQFPDYAHYMKRTKALIPYLF